VQTPLDWAQAAQDSITAIRATGATQEILVSGTDWDGASNWTTDGNATILASNVNDPLNNMAFEVHQYFDNNTGTSTSVSSPMVGPDSLAAITAWAASTGNKLFLGEFGSGGDSASLAALTNTLDFLKANANVWQGGTYWAGGPTMGNYIFNPDPVNGVTSPQASVLALYTP
jgi:endoglucanase